MKTINAQIKAVKLASGLLGRTSKQVKRDHEALKAACTTLIAVRMIGEKKIQALPELIAAAKGVCKEFDCEVDSINAFQKLTTILTNIE